MRWSWLFYGLGASFIILRLRAAYIYRHAVTEWRDGNLIVWASKVAPTIFGDDAEDYDYEMVAPDEKTAAQMLESAKSYVAAVLSGDEDTLLTAFLNMTHMGSMTAEQAADSKWKCGELRPSQRDHVKACEPYKGMKLASSGQRIHVETGESDEVMREKVAAAFQAYGEAVDAGIDDIPLEAFLNLTEASKKPVNWQDTQQVVVEAEGVAQ